MRELAEALSKAIEQLRRIAYVLEMRYIWETSREVQTCKKCDCQIVEPEVEHCPICGYPIGTAKEESNGDG